MQRSFRRVVAAFVLTLFIAAFGALALWGLATVIPPLGTIVVLMLHPVGVVLTYSLSGLLAWRIARPKRDGKALRGSP